MSRLRATLCRLGALVTGMATAAQPATRLYINYSPKPPGRDLLAYDLCILDPHAKVDLQPGHELGHQFLAYLSLVELAKGSQADAAASKREVPLVGSNEDWASHVLDVTSAAWREFILEDCAAAAVAKGYDGFFLDTLDSVDHEGIRDKGQARRAMTSIVRALHERWPKLRLVVNRGFGMLAELAPSLSGVLVESVYQSFDPTTKHYQAVAAEGSHWVEARIREAQALGLTVYAVDYVPPTQRLLAEETVKRLRALHCVPLITTPGLNGQIIAPVSLTHQP